LVSFASACRSLVADVRYRSQACLHAERVRTCRPQEGIGEPVGVTFSATERAANVVLSRDRRTATCAKGYRMVKTTRGVNTGTWYCEFTVAAELKPGAHMRCVCRLCVSRCLDTPRVATVRPRRKHR